MGNTCVDASCSSWKLSRNSMIASFDMIKAWKGQLLFALFIWAEMFVFNVCKLLV